MAKLGVSTCQRNKAATKTDVFISSTFSSAHVAKPPKTLSRHLAHARVESGAALNTAREEYQSRFRRSQARAAIPEAWGELVERGDEDLVELLAGAAELKAGVAPDHDDVAEFLATLKGPVLAHAMFKRADIPVPKQVLQPAVDEIPRSGTLMLQGKAIRTIVLEAMVIVLSELAKRDPTFLERCSQRPDARGRKRRYIARTPEELYADREDLYHNRDDLPGGWLVATNLNNVLKMTIIKLAAEVAGLTFGKDVIVEF